MEFLWSDEQLALQERVIAFAREELDNGGASERDRQGEFPRQAWRKCGHFGIQGMNVPREYGGQGQDLLTATLVMEAMGYACRDNGLSFGLSAQMWSVQPAILHFGSEAQKQRYLPGLCQGELIGCYGMTEPEAGSDAYSLRTQADKCENGYLLNGEKTLITFSPIADFALVFASTNPTLRKWGLTLFVVERGTEGLSFLPVKDKMGLRSMPIGQIKLENCFVPEENRIGPEGAGASIFNSSQEWERALILANQIGSMEYQLEDCIRYAKERVQFGQPIGKFQAVSHRIAEMKLRLETARLLTYKAAWLKQMNRPAMLEAALANLHLSESYLQSSLDAVRIHGGRGYLTENEVERNLRDAVGGVVYGGTSDIQRNIVARLLGL
jgi:alkylation response protein AidB-like acyl-CoA dehydrogenase